MGCLARASKKTAVRVICITLIALTAFSRMYLGVHTPADVGTSLVIGTVLVFALYPLFEKSRENPAILMAVVGVLTACSLAYVIFVETYAWPTDMDPHNLESGIKNGYTLLGCGLAMLVSFYVESRYINFDEKATWQGQLLKLVLGFAIVLGIKAGFKPLLESVLPVMPARSVRYFLMVIFAACIWPLTFPRLSKIGQKKK
jgi:undecaprenyl-diphosphatase